MKQTFDTDTILFGILNNNAALKAAITGGVYKERPLNSVKEDVVVNTITLTQDSEPQIGTSNINIHVADKSVNIAGVPQTVRDDARLSLISGLVLAAVRAAKVAGLTLQPETQTIIAESEIKQHYCNIRINWNIH